MEESTKLQVSPLSSTVDQVSSLLPLTELKPDVSSSGFGSGLGRGLLATLLENERIGGSPDDAVAGTELCMLTSPAAPGRNVVDTGGLLAGPLPIRSNFSASVSTSVPSSSLLQAGGSDLGEGGSGGGPLLGLGGGFGTGFNVVTFLDMILDDSGQGAVEDEYDGFLGGGNVTVQGSGSVEEDATAVEAVALGAIVASASAIPSDPWNRGEGRGGLGRLRAAVAVTDENENDDGGRTEEFFLSPSFYSTVLGEEDLLTE